MPAPSLDHIILLLPHAHLTHPPAWLTANFTLTPGGRHADGRTENALIAFRDGTYIELIAFIDDSPAHRAGHWWGTAPYGLIDWALTSASATDTAALNRRLARDDPAAALGLRYAAPAAGGRTRPDGRELSWLVSFPVGVPRGAAPFFVHDVTPRGLRVPGGAAATTHPCGAVGIARVTQLVRRDGAAAYLAAYAAIADSRAEFGVEGAVLEIEAPVMEAGLGRARPRLAVETAAPEDERGRLAKLDAAVSEIALVTDSSGVMWSRERIENDESGGTAIVINFLHARQTLQ